MKNDICSGREPREYGARVLYWTHFLQGRLFSSQNHRFKPLNVISNGLKWMLKLSTIQTLFECTHAQANRTNVKKASNDWNIWKWLFLGMWESMQSSLRSQIFRVVHVRISDFSVRSLVLAVNSSLFPLAFRLVHFRPLLFCFAQSPPTFAYNLTRPNLWETPKWQTENAPCSGCSLKWNGLDYFSTFSMNYIVFCVRISSCN